MRNEEREYEMKFLPDFEFSSDKELIKRGESVTLRWRVTEAEEVRFWKIPITQSITEPIDWWRIFPLGEEVELGDEIELIIEETTICFLVVKTPLRMAGKKITIEIVEEKPIAEPFICDPPKYLLEKMESFQFIGASELPGKPTATILESHIELVLEMLRQWSAPPTPPAINLSVNPQVIFENESTTLSWSISNANCANGGYSKTQTVLITDTSKSSGTKYDGGGWGAGGSPMCSYPLIGKWTIDGSSHKACHIQANINANNILGKSATSSSWIDILSLPQFKGVCDQSRIAFIKNSIKDMDKKLRNGCIYFDSNLDKSVAAFKDGHLNRKAFWARLLAELQNMKSDTFTCQDVKGTDNKAKFTASASWGDFTNEIILRWKVDLGLMPTPYAILHELVHKCGFNIDLLKYYPGNISPDPTNISIESQTDLVASSCYP